MPTHTEAEQRKNRLAASIRNNRKKGNNRKKIKSNIERRKPLIG